MSFWFSRLSPDGRRVASGERVIHLDGAPLPSPSFPNGLPGTSPQWADADTLVYIPQPSGPLMQVHLGEDPVPHNGSAYNEFHTQNHYLVGWPGSELRRPTVSRWGHVAGVRDLGGQTELVLDGRVIDRGFVFEPRFSEDALVWSRSEDGVRRTYGRRTPDAPTELLSVDPSKDEFWPVAITTPLGLYLLTHGHDRCCVRPWGARQVTWVYVGVTDFPDARWNGSAIRVVASVRGARLDFEVDPAAPLVDLYPQTPPLPDDAFDFVPDGTLVTGAIEMLVGKTPQQDANGIICLHKNTYPECEWRRVYFNEFHNVWLLTHWADASRFPGDRGWWIVPEPTWAADEFRSGQAIATENAQLIDYHHGKANRWRQTNTLFGLKRGGVCVQFDPRFPGQYTDMAKQGTPEWAPAGYEKQWTLADGRQRWQYIVTPLSAKGVVPWGDPSMDVVIQQTESGPGGASPDRPFVPCPRPLPIPEEKEPPVNTFTKQQVVDLLTAPLGHTELNGARKRFVAEVLLDRDKLPQGALAKAADGSDFWPGDVMTGGAATIFDLAMNRAARLALLRGVGMPHAVAEGYHEAVRDYDRAVGRNQSPSPVGPSGAIAGRLRVESGRLRNDAGFFNWQGLSAFALIGHGMQGRWSEVERQIALAAAAGRNLLRVFCMLNPVNGSFGPVTRFTPDMAGWGDDAQEVVDRAAAAGLYTQLNIFADCSEQFGALYTSFEDRRRVLRQVAVRFKDHPAMIFRLANEPYQNGWSEADDRELLVLADDLAEILGHRDFLIGDVKDDGSESGSPEYKARVARVAAHCNVLASHPDRAESGGRERPIEHLKSVFEALHDVAPHCAIVFDEPRGFAGHRQPGRRDNRAAVAVAEACTAAILGCGYTLHAIREQDDVVPGLSEARVALEIPVSPDFRYTNAGLGGSCIGSFDGFYKVRTCDNEQTGFAIGHGPSGTMSPSAGWKFQGSPQRFESDGLSVVLQRLSRE
jgi:hypothetical protein